MIKKSKQNSDLDEIIFSTIIAAKKLKKNKDKEMIKNEKLELENLIRGKYNMHQSNNSDFFISKYKEFQDNQSIEKKLKLRRRIFFNDNILYEILENNNEEISTLKSIKNKYQMKYPDTKFSLSTLSNYVKKDLNFSFRKPDINKNPNTSDLIKNQIDVFMAKLNRIIKEKKIIISLDESSITNQYFRKKLWIKKKSKRKLKVPPRIKSLSVMMAISSKKVLHHRLTKKTFNGNEFIEFLTELENKLKKKKYWLGLLKEKKVLLLLDNAKIHTCQKVRRYLRGSSFSVLFLPPYQPQFQPVEIVWGKIKKELSKYFYYSM
jgi:hypothetical protein